MNSVKSFNFYRSYFECLSKIPEEEQEKLLRAMIYYVFTDEEPEFEGLLSALWIVIKPNLDTSKSRSANPQNKTKTKTKQNKNKTKTKAKQNKNKPIIEEDNDEDIDEDIDEEIEKEIDVDNDFEGEKDNIYTTVEKNFGRTLSPMEYEKINVWLEDYPEEVIEYAVRKSVLANKRNFSYVNGILRSWKSNGYKTLQEIKDDDFSPYERISQDTPNESFDFNWLEESDEY